MKTPLALKARHTVLELSRPERASGPDALPSPAFYYGLLGAGGAVNGITSDEFKWRVYDTQCRAHDLTDATIEECYCPVDEPRRSDLIAKHWRHLLTEPKP